MTEVPMTGKFMVTRKRDLGAGHGEIMFSMEHEPVSRDTLAVAFMNTVNQVDDMIAAYMEAHGIKADMGAHGYDVTEEKHLATGISVTMKDGKRYYKVKCGTWQEHGVAFYPEHMKASGINPALIEDTGYEFKGPTNAIVQMVKGQPKRVIRLEKV